MQSYSGMLSKHTAGLRYVFAPGTLGAWLKKDNLATQMHLKTSDLQINLIFIYHFLARRWLGR